MKNSHTAISTKKGFNYGVWFDFIVNEKQGKQESLNHYRIITNVADQNALQEWLHNICNDPKMIQQLLLTSFFIDNKIKPDTIFESFPC